MGWGRRGGGTPHVGSGVLLLPRPGVPPCAPHPLRASVSLLEAGR